MFYKILCKLIMNKIEIICDFCFFFYHFHYIILLHIDIQYKNVINYIFIFF